MDVGVPGGIAQYRPGGANERTSLIDVTKAPYNADNSGGSNAGGAINAAIAAALPGQVVYLPAGTYRLNEDILLRDKVGVTVRGAGPGQTILRPERSDGELWLGAATDYQWVTPNAEIIGGVSRGDSVINLASTAGFEVGALVQMTMEDHTPNPIAADDVMVFRILGPGRYRAMKSRVVAVDPGNSITIDPPCHFDMPSALDPRISYAGAHPTGSSTKAELCGYEDFTVDASGLGSAFVVWMSQTYACWLYNVKLTDCANYHVYVYHTVGTEIRKCEILRRRGDGSNGSGILWEWSSNGLVEDNIIAETAPHIEVNFGASGNVFAYNYCHDSTQTGVFGASIDGNHGPHPSFNLYEGNIAPNYQSDGYFGSDSESTLFRNWFHGELPGMNGWYHVKLNRFCRKYSVVGNIIGKAGQNDAIVHLGYPNIGNYLYTGTAEPSVGDWWNNWPNHGPVSLYQELDLDVRKSALLASNYEVSGAGGSITDDVAPDTLKKSMFRESRPAYFGTLQWPPFDPQNPQFNLQAIPAGYRFHNGGADPPSDGLVELHGMFELDVVNPNSYTNKFDYGEIALVGTFTAPSGAETDFHGFHAGDGSGGQSGNIWRLRFMPTETGNWTYTYSWTGTGSKPGGASGNFTVIDSDKYGGKLKIDTSNAMFFADSRGNPYHAKPYALVGVDRIKEAPEFGGYAWGTNMADAYIDVMDTHMLADGYNMGYYFLGRINKNGEPRSLRLGQNDNIFDVGVWDDLEASFLHAHDKGIHIWFQAALAHPHHLTISDNLKKYWVARFAPMYNVFGWCVIHESGTGGLMGPEPAANHMRDLKTLDPFGTLLDLHNGSFAGWEDWMSFTSRQHHANYPNDGQEIFNTNNRDRNQYYPQTIPPSFQSRPIFGAEDIWEFVTWTGHGWALSAEDVRRAAWGEMLAGVIPVYCEWYEERPTPPYAPGGLGGEIEVRRMFEFWYSNVDYRGTDFQQLNSLVSAAGRQICSGIPDEQYIVYDDNGGDITIDLSAATGEFETLWFDPKDGTSQAGTRVDGGASRQVSSPFAGDSVLLLTREGSHANRAPSASNQSLATNVDTGLSILLGANDPDGDPLEFSIVSQPANGTLSGNAPSLLYVPSAGHVGSDSFSFKVSDGEFDSNVATVSITINGPTPNRPPVANDDSIATVEDNSAVVTLDASDPDGDPLQYSIVSPPAHGALSGTAPDLVYTPSTGYTGSDGFSFKVSDGELESGTATVSIVIHEAGEEIAVVLEAESGEITAPFMVSGEEVFQLVETPDPANGGQALYRFDVAVAGQYAVSILVDAPDAASNSVFLRFNDQPEGVDDMWPIMPATSGKEERWVRLGFWEDEEGMAYVNPPDDPRRRVEQTFELEAGENTLIMRGRESGTRIDRIKLLRVPTPRIKRTDYQATINR